MRDTDLPLPATAPAGSLDARAVLDSLLERWQAWPADASYVTTKVASAHGQAMLDVTIRTVRETLRSLPTDAPASAVTDLAAPLLRDFWPTRPGPIADVAHEVALLRVRASVSG